MRPEVSRISKCRSASSTWLASMETRRHAASAASSRASAPIRSSVCAALNRPSADRLPAAPFSAWASMRMDSLSRASTRGLDRAQPRRAVVKEPPDHIRQQRLVAVQPFEGRGAVERRSGRRTAGRVAFGDGEQHPRIEWFRR